MNNVSANSEEVKQLPSWLQLIDIPPSNPPNAGEKPKAAIQSRSDIPKLKIRGIRNIYARQPAQDKEDIQRYLEKLRACQSLEDFRRVAADLDGNRHSKIKFSESALQQMLHGGYSLESILQFLSDPSLNIQEAQNLPRLWEWYTSEPRNRSDSKRLHDWLRRHISLGMLSKRELQYLVEAALHSSRDTFGIRPDIDLYQTLLGGLSSSGVDQISDLDGGVLNRILLLASSEYSWQNTALQSFCFKILEACKSAQLKQMTEGISSMLLGYLVSTSPDRDICSLDGHVSKILDCLLLGSETETSRAIASASRAILIRLGSSQPACHLLKRNLNAWWSLLLRHQVFNFIKHRSEWLQIERALARQNIDVLCLYLKHFNDDQKCVFLLRHWFTQDVKDGDNLALRRVSDSTKRFIDVLVSRKGTKCPFIFLFEYLGPTVTAGRIILVRLFSLLNKLELHDTSLALFSYFLRSNISVDLTALARDIICFTSPTPLVACTLYKMTPSLPLESCPSVAEMMIYDSDGCPGVALGFRDLRHESLGVSDVYPRTAHEIDCAQIELLNRMALAYAQASQLYPRVAFRQVYQCYHLLLRKHGRRSLDMAISRAFTVAGVVRPLQELKWVNTTMLRFVLKIIREIEGDEVASKVDEIVYTWRDQLIAKKAEKALELQLERNLGLFPLEEEKRDTFVEMATETLKCEEQRKAEIPQVTVKKLRGKLWGETNADKLLRQRMALDLKFARAAQKAVTEKYGVGDEASTQVLQRLGEDSRAGERADPVYIIPAESES